MEGLPFVFVDRSLGRAAILASGARCFCLSSANLLSQDAAQRYIDNLSRIIRACAEPGPFLYSVQQTNIVLMPLD